jgi:hypothetical protein
VKEWDLGLELSVRERVRVGVDFLKLSSITLIRVRFRVPGSLGA